MDRCIDRKVLEGYRPKSRQVGLVEKGHLAQDEQVGLKILLLRCRN